MTSTDISPQAQVDAQLLEQGVFAPLELLFNSGRLLYGDYESWRRCEIELLDSVLMGNRDKVKAQMEQAVSYARRIGLVEQPQEFYAWDTQSLPSNAARRDKPLRISLDPQLQRLIGSRYVRPQSVPQMDLFFDNPVVALTNGIVQALTTHNLANAQGQLDQLYTQAPTHPDLAAFGQLLAALGHLGHPVENPRQELTFLIEVTPTARRLLGAQALDLLSPLWLQLAESLGHTAFDATRPTLHRSFALIQARDWSAASDSILREPDWQQHTPLCMRLIEGAFNRRRRTEALAAWFHVCWRSPALTSKAVNKLRQPELTAVWQRFLDDEPDLHPAERVVKQTAGPATTQPTRTALPLTEADFPAWLLLREPGLSLQVTEDLATGSTPAEEHYRYVHRWTHARRARRQNEELALRKTLQASHPVLFHLLKQSV